MDDGPVALALSMLATSSGVPFSRTARRYSVLLEKPAALAAISRRSKRYSGGEYLHVAEKLTGLALGAWADVAGQALRPCAAPPGLQRPAFRLGGIQQRRPRARHCGDLGGGALMRASTKDAPRADDRHHCRGQRHPGADRRACRGPQCSPPAEDRRGEQAPAEGR